jgi:hypothetical protein
MKQLGIAALTLADETHNLLGLSSSVLIMEKDHE